MLQREALAGALRVVRTLRGLHYGDLAKAISKTQIANLETGKRTVTLEKIADLADALEIDLIALLTLTVSIQRGESPESALSKAAAALLVFRESGGTRLIAELYSNGQLQKRPTGKPKKIKDLQAVKAIKSAGLTQKDAVAQLQISPSTVHRYWHAPET